MRESCKNETSLAAAYGESGQSPEGPWLAVQSPNRASWAVVRVDPRPRFRVLLLRALQDDLDVRFGHRLPDIRVHDRCASAHVLPEVA
jgi:hypothetical protein